MGHQNRNAKDPFDRRFVTSRSLELLTALCVASAFVYARLPSEKLRLCRRDSWDASFRTSMIACHPSVGDRNLLDAGGMFALSVNYSAMAKTLGMVCGPNPKGTPPGGLSAEQATEFKSPST